ncbi:hypothetical protein RHMOL_Rhmol04G0185900 [Rhododendron molle]|uniref:Uncharacterized protein n=2 Tax=Rhododendron molle TaxID=49168 RepID=A0ACC0P301_RHOML|nr:hypothetical protein RHMOL_Rhmol04G0185900 [Rhododendron molle]KAI8559589.1 hypothetical protein RHMOL_Rhmol04G0185900 [Rhododendron molle]
MEAYPKLDDKIRSTGLKVMVAIVRCEEIASYKLRRLSSDERCLALEDSVQFGPAPGFGNKLSSIRDTYLFEYDMEAFYFDELDSIRIQILEDADKLVSCLVNKLAEIFDSSLTGASSRSCEHVLNVVMQFCKHFCFIRMRQFLRMIMVSALKWVDEVIPDAPYAITEEFMKKLFDEYNIDYNSRG